MLNRLHDTLAAVCPILGVSGAQGAIRIDYDASATMEQRDAAVSALAAFVWTQAEQGAWEAARVPERKDLRDQATQAVSDLDAFLALASPSNAQILAVVKKLCQQNKRIIARLIQVD